MTHITARRVGHDSPSFTEIPFSWLVAWLYDDGRFETDPRPRQKIAEGEPLLIINRWSVGWCASVDEHYGFRLKRKEAP